MYKIDKQFDFAYGHRVWSQILNPKFSIDSKLICRHLHGHQGKLKIGLQSETLNLGMVTDFKHLNCIKKIIDDVFDHKFIMDIHDPLFNDVFREIKTFKIPLIDYKYYKVPDLSNLSIKFSNAEFEKLEGLVVVDFVPTSENICKLFFDLATDLLSELGIAVSFVEFWETPKSHCRYEI